MPRVPARDRLFQIATVATTHFGRLGYRATKTADVAAQANMSTGSLFTYVESKEALFHLVFLYWFEMSSEHLPVLPVATPGEGETLAVIEAGLGHIEMPRIRAALLDDEPADAAEELREILEERYALLEHYWPLLAVIERCAVEMPALEATWFGLVRAGTSEELGRYLERRMAAGLVTESLSWFAWHRREGRDANLYDEAAGKRTVVEFICAALVHPTVGETTARSPRPTKSAGEAKKRDPRRKGSNARNE